MRTLPATAQVARQQGLYLARNFNRMARDTYYQKGHQIDAIEAKTLTFSPFFYRNFGMTAYLGTKRVAVDLGNRRFTDRFIAFWLWRSIYLNNLVSLRTRMMVAIDWVKTTSVFPGYSFSSVTVTL